MVTELYVVFQETWGPAIIETVFHSKVFFLLSVLSPLLGFLINFFGSSKLTKFQSGAIAVGFLLLSCYGSYMLFLPFLSGEPFTILERSKWVTYYLFTVNWTFLLDPLSTFMLVVITTVSLCVHFYSYEYMYSDPNLGRFLAFLNLFTFFMIMLVVAGNLVQLFVGWEGVGLSSYLLINFWHTRLEANKSALKAIIMNRIGDCSLLVAIFIAYWYYGTFDFILLSQLLSFLLNYSIVIFGFKFDLITSFGFFILIGAFAKSAQLGLHTWLPDAMEGPTPVSALLHAATMVTAGVYLVTRFSFVLEYSPLLLNFCLVFGSLTAFFGSTVALVQVDLKKVIAFSTCSQLGYMFAACGASAYNVAMYHLMTHATFKALLFLGAGAIIHSLNNEQDIRRMGGLINFMPLTFIFMLIGFLSLMGFPFLSGFYSKDLILEVCFAKGSVYGLFAFWFCLISAGLTAFYSFRTLFYVFLTKPNFTNFWRHNLMNIHDLSFHMFLSLLPLALGSIVLGFFIKDFTVGMGTSFWQNSIFFLGPNLTFHDAEFLPVKVKLAATFAATFGFWFACWLYYYKSKDLYRISFKNIYVGTIIHFLSRKWCFDVLYNKFIVAKILNRAYVNIFRDLDRGLFEYYGPFGGMFRVGLISQFVSHFQNSRLSYYGFMGIVSIIVLFGFILHFILGG